MFLIVIAFLAAICDPVDVFNTYRNQDVQGGWRRSKCGRARQVWNGSGKDLERIEGGDKNM